MLSVGSAHFVSVKSAEMAIVVLANTVVQADVVNRVEKQPLQNFALVRTFVVQLDVGHGAGALTLCAVFGN